jgi:subtilisin-like proprotein convertase family protein
MLMASRLKRFRLGLAVASAIGLAAQVSCREYLAVNLPAAIPDDFSGTGQAIIPMADSFIPDTIRVLGLNVTHPRLSDIDAILFSPRPLLPGVILINIGSLSRANIQDANFDDSAAQTIDAASAPYTGSFRPHFDPLGTLATKRANGDWVVEINDPVPGAAGTITGVRLEFCGANVPGPTPTPAGFEIIRSTFGTTGVLASGTTFSLKGATGQESVIGRMAGSTLAANTGFWHAATQVLAPPTPSPLRTDVNGDGIVDILDLVEVARDFGKSSP